MLAVMKNDWNRLMQQKMYLCVAMLLTILSVVAAIFITTKVQVRSNIAVTGLKNESMREAMQDSEIFHVTFPVEVPAESELLENRYDAVIAFLEDGSYQIHTVKSDDFSKQLESMLNNISASESVTSGTNESITSGTNESVTSGTNENVGWNMDFEAYNSSVRKIGTNILGYMMMFLLMQGVLYARLFAEDKEKHLIERIVSGPIAFRSYITGHAVFIGLLVFVPSMLVVTVADLMGIEVGFSIGWYAVLIAVLSLMATAFAMFINAFFIVADTANMCGSAVIVLTSVLAGSFYSISKSDSLFNNLLHILPQKDFIQFADVLEKGNVNNSNALQLLYVIIISVLFLFIAVYKTRKDYVYR